MIVIQYISSDIHAYPIKYPLNISLKYPQELSEKATAGPGSALWREAVSHSSQHFAAPFALYVLVPCFQPRDPKTFNWTEIYQPIFHLVMALTSNLFEFCCGLKFQRI